jgi:hypothetical protein
VILGLPITRLRTQSRGATPRGSRVARNVSTRRHRCRRPTLDGAAMGARPQCLSDGRLTGSPSSGRLHRPSGTPAVSEGDRDQGSVPMAVSIGLGKPSISASTSPQLFPSSHGDPESSEMGRSRTRERRAKKGSPRCERGSGPHPTDFFWGDLNYRAASLSLRGVSCWIRGIDRLIASSRRNVAA